VEGDAELASLLAARHVYSAAELPAPPSSPTEPVKPAPA
jgi:hypothetical protein